MIKATHHQSFYDTSREISICLIYFPFSFSLFSLSLSYAANSILMLFIIIYNIYDRQNLRELVYFSYFEHICNHVYLTDVDNTLKPDLFRWYLRGNIFFIWLVLTRFLLHGKSIYECKSAFWLKISNKELWFHNNR